MNDLITEDQLQGTHPPVVAPTVMTVTPEIDAQEEFKAVADKVFAEEDPGPAIDALSGDLLREFDEAERLRRKVEERWLKDLRQFRGIYEPDVESKLANRSKSFVRRTRVKVVTTDARMMDYLFPAGQEKNWTCTETPKPSVSNEMRQTIAQRLVQQSGQQGEPSKEAVEAAVLAFCKEAAKGMTKVMDDQLVEIRYKQVTKKAVHSGNLYGTGILKGPLVERRVRQRFSQEGAKWKPKNEEYIVPFVDFVPLWRFYPDMAPTDLEQLRFAYERHLMTRHEFSALASRRTFKKQVILDHIQANPRGCASVKWFENEVKSLGDREEQQTRDNGMYEVLERWGWLTGEQLKQAGVRITDDRLLESFFSNVWLLPNGQIIKAVLQPINGVTWPYHLYYFDKDETSIFGEGLAAIMRDDQEMLNAAVRMMLDNGALTSGPMLEIVLSELAVTERADEVFPWKIWYRKSGANMDKPAVRQIQLDNNLEWLSKMASMFEQNTDEVTAIPRYMTGENATTGAAGTASGMSMLMGAANIIIKELLGSWDEGVTRTFIQSLYRWNMQFNRDNSIKGDFDVKARGTASLIAKELRGQQLDAFAQQTAEGPDAPFVNRHELLLARSEALELPAGVVMSREDVEKQKNSEQAKRAAQMQQELADAQLRAAQGQAAKLLAEAEVAKTKVEEMLKNIDKTIAETVATRVETIFAALQGGGAATRDPVTAPAGDEILRSAGYRDNTPQPTIAQLNTPPVQQEPGTHRLMNKGQSFAVEPRGAVQPQQTVPPEPGPAPGAQEMPDANTGQRAGIETTRIE